VVKELDGFAETGQPSLDQPSPTIFVIFSGPTPRLVPEGWTGGRRRIWRRGLKRTTFIVNPNAGTGAAARQWPRVRRVSGSLLGPVESRFTRGPGDALRYAAEAAVSGVDLLVCVGGDGTLNEVVNGLLSTPADVRGSCVLGYVPCGTGCDLSRTLSIPRDPVRAVEAIAGGRTRTLDAGRVAFRGNRGAPERRFFHNVVSFGLGGEVDERVNRGSKALGGFVSFIRATLLSVLLFRKKRIRFRLDGGAAMEAVAWNVVVANGRFHGGGMCVAPDAAADDGLLNVTVIGDLALWQVFLHLPKLYNGKLKRVARVRTFVAKRIEAWSTQRVLLDVDGEQPGRLPVVIETVPGAIRMAADPLL
jgi:YegS/Rv2252/BmrU family lipid kinase